MGSGLIFLVPFICFATIHGAALNIDVPVGQADVNGVLGGNRGVNKRGDGLVFFNAKNTYTGPTVVADGALLIGGGGEIVGPVTISPGKIFGGTGEAKGSITNFGGTIIPGDYSVGELRVGSYLGDSSSALQIQFNPFAASRMVVTHDAVLDGTLQVVPETTLMGGVPVINANVFAAGFSRTYTIVSIAGDCGGEPVNLSVPDALGFVYALDYDTHSKDLLLTLINNSGKDISISRDQKFTYTTISRYPYSYFFPEQTVQIISTSTVIQAAPIVAEVSDNIITTFQNNHPGVQGSSGGIKDASGFTNNLRQVGSTKGKSTLEYALHALSERDPINLEGNQGRVWLSGYKSVGNVASLNSTIGTHSSTVGGLMGTEYFYSKKKFTIGMLFGTFVGKQSQAGQPLTNTQSNGINYGIYGSVRFLKEAKVDLMLTNLKMNFNSQRFDAANNQIAQAKYQMKATIADTMLSYLWKFPENYSLRLNIGNTYVSDQTGGYTETGAGNNNITQTTSNHKSHEGYGGIGVRKGWLLNGILWRLTGLYELGYKYLETGTHPVASASRVAPVILTLGVRRITNYFNLNLSALSEEIGFKAILGYSGTLSPKTKDQGRSIRHMLTLKLEHRF